MFGKLITIFSFEILVKLIIKAVTGKYVTPTITTTARDTGSAIRYIFGRSMRHI